MVKSPWKLLTGLLSRGKTADQHDVGQANLTEAPNEVEGPRANPTASEASVGGEPAFEPEPSAGSQAGKGETGDRQEPPLLMAAEVPDPMPKDEAIPLAPDSVAVIVGPKRRKPRDKAPSAIRRKTKTEAPFHTSSSKPVTAFAEQAAANEPDPVRALDTDIRELRSQLAVKLRLQNDQLRQMLKRFESK